MDNKDKEVFEKELEELIKNVCKDYQANMKKSNEVALMNLPEGDQKTIALMMEIYHWKTRAEYSEDWIEMNASNLDHNGISQYKEYLVQLQKLKEV
jgi:thymidylate synthase ThyX